MLIILLYLNHLRLKNFLFNVYGISSDNFSRHLVSLKILLLDYFSSRTIFFVINTRRHLFHLVTPSPWPLLSSIAAFFFFVCFVLYMYNFIFIEFYFLFSLVILIFVMFFWWMDVVRESTFLGYHTKVVQRGLKIGVVLFIVSEVFFFFGFFWAFFHSSLSVSIELGCIWPPTGINIMYFAGVPLLNTFLLLTSGTTITVSHHSLVASQYIKSLNYLWFTVVLSFFFIYFQYLEYCESLFNISDSIYGSTFFMLTGFHGFHVIVGTVFLLVCFFRILVLHFKNNHHVGFESAAWYWHFVDVVWLFLFISVYWWGSIGFIN